MESSIHLYKLFESTKSPISIQIPETIIIGYGFVSPTLISYSSCLVFTPLTHEKALEHLSFLYSSCKILCKTSKNSEVLTELPKDLGSEVVYQVYVSGKTCIARWTSCGGFLSIEYPMTLRLQFEYIKNLINKQLSNTSRLAKLEVEFIISIQSIIYCIAVTNYSYTHLQSLTRLSSF